MNVKLDLRTKMQELQRAYAATAGELKALEEAEKKIALKEKFKDYTIKVFVSDKLPAEPKFEEVSDEDREHGFLSPKMGVPMSGGYNDGAYLLLKTKEEYTRLKLLNDRISAVKSLEDKAILDKTDLIKTILGEE